MAMALLLIGSLGVLRWQRTHQDNLRLTCLDVGHGQAIVVQLPGTEKLLFDAGSLYTSDVGTRIVCPFLEYAGIDHLDAIVLSHGDIDHINGVPEIVDRHSVDRVYTCGPFLAEIETRPTLQTLAACLRNGDHAIELMPAMLAGGGTTIRRRWPPDKQPDHLNLVDNDESLVASVEFARVNILLCSDIEQPGQQQIMQRYPLLRADIVLVPHHGSVRTLDGDLLDCLGASILVCSCSRSDVEGGRVVSSWAGCRVLTTAVNGAIDLSVGTDGTVRVSTFVHRSVLEGQ